MLINLDGKSLNTGVLGSFIITNPISTPDCLFSLTCSLLNLIALLIELSTALALLVLSTLNELPFMFTISWSTVVTRGYLFIPLPRCLATVTSTAGYVDDDVTAGNPSPLT